jgi:hypothetical protein
MGYTIIQKRRGKRKYILFLNRLCNSTMFYFVVNPKTEYCSAYCPLLKANEKIDKSEIKAFINTFKDFIKNMGTTGF